jgi:hypothetical protein
MLIALSGPPRIETDCPACRLIGDHEVDVAIVWSVSHRRHLGRMPDRYPGRASSALGEAGDPRSAGRCRDRVTDGLLVAADLLMDTDFNEGDRLLMVQALDDLSGDQTLEAQARTNTLDNFRHAFEPAAIDAILNRNQRNGEITEQFMGNPELRRMMLDAMMLDYYERARRAEPDDRSAA